MTESFLPTLVAALASELAAEKFVRVDAPPPFALVLRRQTLFGQRHLVVVVNAEPGPVDLATLTVGHTVAIQSTIGKGNVLVVWVGAGLSQRAAGIESALGGDIAVRGIFVVDLAERRMTTAGNKVSEPTNQFRNQIGAIVQRTLGP